MKLVNLSKVNTLTENQCIHITTEENWKKIVPRTSPCFELFKREKNICFFPSRNQYLSLNQSKISSITIFNENDFFYDSEKFEMGEKVIAPNDVLFNTSKSLFYVGETKRDKFVVEDEQGRVYTCDYIEKLETAKNKAIEEIKKLAKEHNINIKDIK